MVNNAVRKYRSTLAVRVSMEQREWLRARCRELRIGEGDWVRGKIEEERFLETQSRPQYPVTVRWTLSEDEGVDQPALKEGEL